MVITRSQALKHLRSEKSDGSTRAEVVTPRIVDVHIPTRISSDRPVDLPQPFGLSFKLQPAIYGIMQERIRTSLYALMVQSILWNQTHGLKARPILFKLLSQYPTPVSLSLADVEDLRMMLLPIGLQNIRAARLITFAKAWVAAPPCKERRYRRLHYPTRGCGMDTKPREVLALDDEREGWEIAHLCGVGAYALDSFRIFHRDRLRGLDGLEGVEPEWKRVNPTDKDLKAYLDWKSVQ